MTHGAVIHGGTIGNNVLIGVNAAVLESAHVGNYCLIGACALVLADANIPDESLVIGVPGRVSPLTEEHRERLKDPTGIYVRNARRFRRPPGVCARRLRGRLFRRGPPLGGPPIRVGGHRRRAHGNPRGQVRSDRKQQSYMDATYGQRREHGLLVSYRQRSGGRCLHFLPRRECGHSCIRHDRLDVLFGERAFRKSYAAAGKRPRR
ncbi:MAG: hypothetical protein IH897_16185 [Planctomycetes bacterium]|nr:hypothetical protein [Planctomycetota bacterium]